MKKIKNSKIRKIAYKKVWPSVLAILIFTTLSTFLMGAFMDLFADYLISSKLEMEKDNTRYMAEVIEENLADGTQIEEMKKAIKTFHFSKDEYCITDKEKNIILEQCSTKPLFDKELLIDFGEEYSLCLDEKSKDSFIKDNRVNISFDKFFTVDTIFHTAVGVNGKESRVVELFRADYWNTSDILDGTYTLYKKGTVVVTIKDFIFVLGMVILVGVLLLLILIYTLANIFSAFRRQRKIRTVLYTDPVTGGNNWLHFVTSVDKTISSLKNTKNSYAIVDLKMQRYDDFCACYGVEQGEKVLEKIMLLMTKVTKKQETFCYVGKGSFGIFLQVYSTEHAIERVEALLEALPNVSEASVEFGAGIYLVETKKNEAGKYLKRKDVDIDYCYSCAGIARVQRSSFGDVNCNVFSEELLEEQIWERKVIEKMDQAIEKEEFQVYLQPKYNPVTNELAGAEALVRWINEEDGFVSPGKFIPIFEKNGLITKLDDYMISHVAMLQSKWLKEGKKLVPVSVNVSRIHFMDPNLAEHICNLVDAYETPHEYVEIELTESAFFDDKKALLHTVDKLQKLGFAVSMDDFGSGYSSLNSLKDLPLDVLKLDAEFFRGDNQGERGEIVVSEAIRLAKSLDMKIVAEGIEKKEQVDFLASLNCDMIQGFYFAKPMPVEEYEKCF